MLRLEPKTLGTTLTPVNSIKDALPHPKHSEKRIQTPSGDPAGRRYGKWQETFAAWKAANPTLAGELEAAQAGTVRRTRGLRKVSSGASRVLERVFRVFSGALVGCFEGAC